MCSVSWLVSVSFVLCMLRCMWQMRMTLRKRRALFLQGENVRCHCYKELEQKKRCTSEMLRAERCDEVYGVYNSWRYDRATPHPQIFWECLAKLKSHLCDICKDKKSSAHWTVPMMWDSRQRVVSEQRLRMLMLSRCQLHKGVLQ